MTPRDAFKVTVLAACAARGLDTARTHALVKQALADPGLAGAVKRADPVTAVLRSPFDLARSVVGAAGPTLVGMGTLGALGLPVGVGLLGGHAVARAQDDDTNIEAAKADELILAYQQLAENARRRSLAKGLRPLPGRTTPTPPGRSVAL
jgi:hypothetical protein